eukprot:19098-Heterococcus_DN1.PRE.5
MLDCAAIRKQTSLHTVTAQEYCDITRSCSVLWMKQQQVPLSPTSRALMWSHTEPVRHFHLILQSLRASVAGSTTGSRCHAPHFCTKLTGIGHARYISSACVERQLQRLPVHVPELTQYITLLSVAVILLTNVGHTNAQQQLNSSLATLKRQSLISRIMQRTLVAVYC